MGWQHTVWLGREPQKRYAFFGRADAVDGQVNGPKFKSWRKRIYEHGS